MVVSLDINNTKKKKKKKQFETKKKIKFQLNLIKPQ